MYPVSKYSLNGNNIFELWVYVDDNIKLVSNINKCFSQRKLRGNDNNGDDVGLWRFIKDDTTNAAAM